MGRSRAQTDFITAALKSVCEMSLEQKDCLESEKKESACGCRIREGRRCFRF